jgi:hypothetical protein
MFPTIFSLALRDAGTKTKLTSSLLIMTKVGGAIAPVIMGILRGYYWEYGDCLSHTVGMLWGDWRGCGNAKILFDWYREGLKE